MIDHSFTEPPSQARKERQSALSRLDNLIMMLRADNQALIASKLTMTERKEQDAKLIEQLKEENRQLKSKLFEMGYKATEKKNLKEWVRGLWINDDK